MHDAVVVGGGIAGLTVAYRLLAAGRQVICLEADPVAGGCVRTDRVAGLLCERGAQNVLEEAGGPVRRLADDLGIGAEILHPSEKGNFIAWGGRLCSMPAQLHRVLSVGGMARAARGLVLAKAPAGRDESVAVWARRRFGGEFASRVIDPMISGICAGDPERLSLDAAFPELGNLEQRHRSLAVAAFRKRPTARHHYSFRNGMGVLTEALTQRLGPAIRTGIKATAITAEGRGQYRIDCEDPTTGRQAPRVLAHSVIVAAPAAAAVAMMSALDPCLERLLGGIESAPVVTASLAFSPADFDSGPPQGYGLVRPRCEGSRLLGCLFPSSAFAGTAPPGVIHLRVLAGGRRDPDAYRLSDGELLDLAREELRPILGLRRNATPSVFHAVRHRFAFPQYEIGHLERVREIERTLLGFPRVHLAGNSYYGLSVSKVVERAEQLSARLLERRAAA
jgi:oxygen-dependent protoporphyrinogen oxidase